MKITKLRFQNLNSLAGTWCIDFTDPAYRETSLFAITGPTGAGKSTLLDAICLALYGRTPRLDKVTKSSNEIMSKHTGVCFAEVEFETIQGSFRCHWSQHRSRKKSSGELQQPKHEIVEIPSGIILESRMKDVLLKVEEVSGMDFDRFTRSTLLAQGGFAAFLQAKADERAPLLEQITGSRIYSQISIQVHETYTLEKEKVTQLEKDLSHLIIFSKEKENTLTMNLEEARKTQRIVKNSFASLKCQQLWLTNIHQIQTEIRSHSCQLADLEQEYSKKKLSLQALPMAVAAKELEPLFLEIKRINNNQKINQELFITLEKKKKRLTPTIDTLAKALKQHHINLNQALEKRKIGLELIAKVQQLDFTLEVTTKNNTISASELVSLKREQALLQKEISVLQAKLQAIQQSKQQVDLFFEERKNEEELITGYLLIENKITKLLQLRKRELMESGAIHQHGQTEDTTDFSAQLTALQKESADIKKELDFLQSKLQLLIRIQSLEEERNNLLANDPCPLCGSTKHPYSTKQLIEISEGERLPELFRIQEMLHKRAIEWKKKKSEQEKLEKQFLVKTNSLEHASKQNKLLQTNKLAKEESLVQQKEALQHLVRKRKALFGSKGTTEQTDIFETQVKNLRQSLEKIQNEHLSSDKELTAITSRLLAISEEQKRQKRYIDEREILFAHALQNSPFSSQDAFLSSLLTPQEINALQNSTDTYAKQQTELNSLLHDKKTRLAQEVAKVLTRENIQTIEAGLVEQEQKLEELQRTIISTQEQLQQNTSIKQKYRQKLITIGNQKSIFGRWKRLHMLIGSADGKTFRNFAQGLTFELMVVHANHHLARMNNRYILIRDTDMPLNLNVIDTYQAGEIRSTKNLSGGESFLISLALALALSRMASNKIRVDSLFLDEGFGSLDEEALESALDTLSELHEDNKLIGVISHVVALKERIPLQIEISSKNGWKSSMEGPGISRE